MVFSPDRAYLVNTCTGKPVFITGEDAFSLVGQLSNSDIESYLSDRAGRGFNLIWVGAVDNTYSRHPPANALGQSPFNGPPFTHEQEAFFAHLDDVLQRAASHGITVLLNPTFSGYVCDDAYGWCPELEAASDSDITAFGAYLGNRYKSYSNIVWLIGGDAKFTPQEGTIRAMLNGLLGRKTIKRKLNDLAEGIRSVDKVHLMTAENIRGQAALDQWSHSSWMTLNSTYSLPSATGSDAAKNYQRLDFLPFFLLEDYYENEHNMTELEIRREGYWAVLSGATLGRMWGNNPIWCFDSPNPPDACNTTTNWQSQLSSAGSVGQQWLGALFRSREHWRMAPDIDHAVVTVGYGAGESLTTAARTRDGQTVIAYIPNGNAATLSVDMTKITSASKMAKGWWFNPSNGATTPIGNFANAGSHSFTPPDSNDWVLVIDDADAKLPAPGGAAL
jgi:hypothetical protein